MTVADHLLDYVFAFACPVLIVLVVRDGKQMTEDKWIMVAAMGVIGLVSFGRAVGLFA